MISIDGYFFDASLSESHVREAEITEFPIENGSPITDHRIRRPLSVTIEFAKSDTPINEALADWNANLRAGFGQNITPGEEALAFLEKLDEDGRSVLVSSKLRDYDDMVLESLEIVVNPDNDGYLEGTAVFKQITIVENRKVFVDVIEPRGGKKRNLGAKQGAEIVGPPVTDGASGKNVQYVVPAPGESGRFWYATSDGTPYRELSQEELDDMNAADISRSEDYRHDGSDWIDTRTGRPVPQSVVPSERYPGDPEDIRNRSRVGNPWFVGTGRGK